MRHASSGRIRLDFLDRGDRWTRSRPRVAALRPHRTVKALETPKGSGALTLSGHVAALQHADNEGMDTIARPVLSLVCPGCGGAFPSAMQMDPRTFAGIRISKVLECFPKCSRVSRFSKTDYLFDPTSRSVSLRRACQAERGRPKGRRTPILFGHDDARATREGV
jgi:hypothetical protein